MPFFRKYVVFVCLAIMTTTVAGQGGVELIKPDQLQSVTPPSPNAAALGKYGEIPVGTYNGLPEISVPIYQINSGKLQVPISLSYHAAGIRVEEVASNVGLGWNLSLPGAIVRQTRGLPDELTGGYQNSNPDVYRFINNQMTETEREQFFTDIKAGLIDTEPDLFTYNINGLSGSFFFDLDDNVVTIPKTTLSITKTSLGWKIIDNNGFIYNFSEAETTVAVPGTSLGGTTSYTQFESITSWFISSIENPDNAQDKITFQYESYSYSFITISSQTKYVNNSADLGCPSKDPTSFYSTNTITGQRLKKIVFKDGHIDFIKETSARLDVIGDYALSSIEIANSTGTLNKKFSFSYRYSVSPGESGAVGSFKQYYHRLILDKILIGDGSSISEGEYSFQYNTGDLPSRLSFNQDYWGYFNGADNQFKLVPTTNLQPAGGGTTITVGGANRKVNPAVSKAAMLTTIKYPTGGMTAFLFENNRILTSTSDIQTGENQGFVSVGTIINGGNGITESQHFTLVDCEPNDLNPFVTCQMTVFNSGCGGGLENLECPRVTLYKSTGEYVGPTNTSGNINLLPGSYFLRLDVSGVPDEQIANSAYASLSYPICQTVVIGGVTYVNQLSGGHRIREISSFDQLGKLASCKKYVYDVDSSGNSSGRIISLPNHLSALTEVVQITNSQGTIFNTECQYFSISSGSNYPLTNTKSSSTGYGYVVETEGPNGEGGKTEYYYTTAETHADFFNPEFPFPPSTSRDWMRGNLIKEVKSKTTPTGSQKVQERTITYAENELFQIFGLKTGQSYFPVPGQGSYTFLQSAPYQIQSGWLSMNSETIVNYDATTESRSNQWATAYQYNFTNQQVNTTEGTAKKGTIVNKTRFVTDYTTVPANIGSDENDGLVLLKNRNIVTAPVEQYSIRKEGGQEYVVAGRLIAYSPSVPLPKKVYTLEIKAPILLSNFVVSSINSAGELIMDARYKESIVNEYDEFGNTIMLKKSQDMPNSVLWGYKQQYPVAEVQNAEQNEIAATSFESSDDPGRWTGIISGNIVAGSGVTGKKYYNLTPAGITVANLPVNSHGYIISYWSKNGFYFTGDADFSGKFQTEKSVTINGETWTLYQKKIRGDIGTITISGTGAIDEVRVFPNKGNMTTYTYDPHIGMTSKCDLNNMITYYEYDSVGRLKLIRDHEYNIVKTFQYQYLAPIQ